MAAGDYGFDAPYALASLAGAGVLSALGAIGSLAFGESHVARVLSIYAVVFLGQALSFLYTTRRGKFQAWSGILERLHLHGDERVLDMGCGRGAVLTAVARRLTTGRVTGVDLWSTKDQSGNSAETTLRNASLEGVSDRIRLETGDMRALPFPAAAFDVVVSSLAIHNIPSAAGRAQAIAEAWRVLRPGGRLAIADIRKTRDYAKTLRGLGAANVARRNLGWRFWYGNPFGATSLVTADKRS